MDDVYADDDTCTCPICHDHHHTADLFVHVFTEHPAFLAVWSSLNYPSIANDTTPSWYCDDWLIPDANQQLELDYENDVFPSIYHTYEDLSDLCDMVGDHHILRTIDMDAVAPPITHAIAMECNATKCPVCLESFVEENDPPTLTPPYIIRKTSACNHIFCRDCLDTWLHMKPTCPICRVELVASTES